MADNSDSDSDSDEIAGVPHGPCWCHLLDEGGRPAAAADDRPAAAAAGSRESSAWFAVAVAAAVAERLAYARLAYFALGPRPRPDFFTRACAGYVVARWLCGS